MTNRSPRIHCSHKRRRPPDKYGLDKFQLRRDFFSAVGHLGMRRHPEDQLTNVFQACFTHSTVFRKAVLKKLWTLCDLGGVPPKSVHWNCSAQISDQDSRYDIYISAEQLNLTRIRPPFFIVESKLAAPLTSAQLIKYSKRNRAHAHCIAVITKDHPQVAQAWLSEHGIAALRWQDLYQVLHEVSQEGNQVDKFLITQFLQYLSRANMAYESVSSTHLHDFARLLRAISRGRRDGVVNRGRKAFSTGDAVLRLLKEVQVISVEYLRNPSNFNIWGPGYDRYEDDGIWHSLCFSFYSGSRSINCGISFSDDAKEEVLLDVYYWDDKTKDYYRTPSYSQSVDYFMNNGVLDKDKISRKCRDLFERWGVARVRKASKGNSRTTAA